ncbi:MAG: hypothetical protein ACRYFW_14800 [Janthinobacterium lividum]
MGSFKDLLEEPDSCGCGAPMELEDGKWGCSAYCREAQADEAARESDRSDAAASGWQAFHDQTPLKDVPSSHKAAGNRAAWKGGWKLANAGQPKP